MKRATIMLTPYEIKKQLGLELTNNEIIVVNHNTDRDGNLIVDCVVVEK